MKKKPAKIHKEVAYGVFSKWGFHNAYSLKYVAEKQIERQNKYHPDDEEWIIKGHFVYKLK